MSEQPQRRLVSKGEYVGVMAEKLSLYFFGALQLACGIAGVILTVVLIRQISSDPHGTSSLDETLEVIQVSSFVVGAASLLLMASGRFLFTKARKIDPVTVLTTYNAHLLPPEESLVRASDLPPSQQQAELLRAARNGAETPSGELLRATQGKDQE